MDLKSPYVTCGLNLIELLINWLQVRVLSGSSALKELLNIPIEQLLSMCRFENKGKLDDLGLEIDTTTLKSGD
jgi:hypothetical protein